MHKKEMAERRWDYLGAVSLMITLAIITTVEILHYFLEETENRNFLWRYIELHGYF